MLKLRMLLLTYSPCLSICGLWPRSPNSISTMMATSIYTLHVRRLETILGLPSMIILESFVIPCCGTQEQVNTLMSLCKAEFLNWFNHEVSPQVTLIMMAGWISSYPSILVPTYFSEIKGTESSEGCKHHGTNLAMPRVTCRQLWISIAMDVLTSFCPKVTGTIPPIKGIIDSSPTNFRDLVSHNLCCSGLVLPPSSGRRRCTRSSRWRRKDASWREKWVVQERPSVIHGLTLCTLELVILRMLIVSLYDGPMAPLLHVGVYPSGVRNHLNLDTSRDIPFYHS